MFIKRIRHVKVLIPANNTFLLSIHPEKYLPHNVSKIIPYSVNSEPAPYQIVHSPLKSLTEIYIDWYRLL